MSAERKGGKERLIRKMLTGQESYVRLGARLSVFHPWPKEFRGNSSWDGSRSRNFLDSSLDRTECGLGMGWMPVTVQIPGSRRKAFLPTGTGLDSGTILCTCHCLSGHKSCLINYCTCFIVVLCIQEIDLET